jgi:pSer/pThr/pTyr-binding forkhead associated (FHA) protein
MGRAPNPGAPQRVSAHVVPKAPSFATYDEDEKTTIESGGWEEEASTTVEQRDVADKVRALGLGLDPLARPNTSVTSTNGSGMADEPTVDEQRANVAHAQLPPPGLARLVITLGNDAGQAIEVRPGKSYTIGRALDNDLVLTDMTVSRKHFDLKSDNGSWVLSDRGSGNGTLINTRLEDAPFTLANGDVIEIGNTTFRFELPNGVPRVATSFGPGDDDIEQSTTSGKPLQEPEPATPEQLITSVSRPKTLPPPAPLPRSRPATRPPPPFAHERASPAPLGHPPIPASVLAAASAPTLAPMQGLTLHQLQQPPPSTTLPLPQMANRPPLQPGALLDPSSPPPTTLPGHGTLMHPAHPARLPFSYPSSTEMPRLPARGTSRAIAVVSAQPPRDATSTALVQPMTYSNGQVAISQRPYTPPPELSRRTKMVLAGTGLALFAAIATIAIVKSAGGDGRRSPLDGHGTVALQPTTEPDAEAIEIVEPSAAAPASPTRTITPIDPPPDPPRPEPLPEAVPPPTTTQPTTAQPTSAQPTTAQPTTTQPTTAQPTTAQPTTAQPASVPAPAANPPSTSGQPPAVSPTAATTAAQAAARTDAIATPPVQPAKPAPIAPAAASVPGPIVTPIAPAPPTPAPSATPAIRTDGKPQAANAPRSERKQTKRPERKPDRKTTVARVDTARIEIDRTPKSDASAPATPGKKTARTIQDVKSDANVRYRARDFSGAAAVVNQSLPSFSGGDAQDLKGLATVYSQLGKSFHIGMAPGTGSVDAYLQLRRALMYDRDVGSAYHGVINERLVVVATRAAMQYMASKNFEPAFRAVRESEALGSTSPSNKVIREKLESVAADLLRAASSELASNPEEAKRKARQVEGMVDTRHPLHVRATRLLNGS